MQTSKDSNAKVVAASKVPTTLLMSTAIVAALAGSSIPPVQIPPIPVETVRRLGGPWNSAQVRLTSAAVQFASAAPRSAPSTSSKSSPKEAIMAELDGLDRPWSRRLRTLDATTRVEASSLHAMIELLRRSDEAGWPIAGVFPGEDGGLRIEWRVSGEHTVYEVDDEGAIYAGHFDFVTGAESDIETFDSAEAVKFLGEHLHA